MIIDAIRDAIMWVVETVLEAVIDIVVGLMDLAPDISIPDLSTMLQAGEGVWAYVGWANNFVPVDQLALIIGLVVLWWMVLHGVRAVLWLLTKAHVLGGSS